MKMERQLAVQAVCSIKIHAWKMCRKNEKNRYLEHQKNTSTRIISSEMPSLSIQPVININIEKDF